MAVHSQSIHRPGFGRRGAVMIYALVFAITAAVTLYVASSIYQARQKANALRAYNEQKTLLGWDFKHILRATQQNSLDGGLGLTDMDGWSLFNANTHAYSSVSWDTTIRPDVDGGEQGRTLFSGFQGYDNVLWQAVGTAAHTHNSFFVNNLFVATTEDSRIDMSGDTVHDDQRSFTASDILTIPTWRPRRNGEAGSATAVSPHEPTELNQNFVLITSAVSFPDQLRWRSDLPFGPTPEQAWTLSGVALQETGFARWARDGLAGTLTPQNVAMAAITGNVDVSGYTWAVEEPITNYQLVLLDPLNGVWAQGGNLTGSIRVSDAALNNTVNRPKILIWGSVDGSFATNVKGGFLTGRDSTGPAPDLLPLAMVVRGSVDPAVLAVAPAVGEGFEWRMAKPSTQLSLGRHTPVNPGDDLGKFLINDAFASFTTPNISQNERQLEILNTQASIMPPFTSTADPKTFCYINSVLSFSEDGKVKWSAQSNVAGSAGLMGPIYQLPYKSGTGVDYWIYKDPSANPPNTLYNPSLPAEKDYQVSLKYGNPPDAPPQTFDNYTGAQRDTLGLSGVHYYQPGFTASVVTVDLSKVAVNPITAAGDPGNPPNTPAWMSPIEINIHNDNPSSTRLLYVRIKGDASAAAGNNPPVRIVVRNAQEVRLIPDAAPSVAGVGNLRRFILTSTDLAPMRLTLETSGVNYRWYGVLIAPYGVTVNNYSPMNITGSTVFLGNPQGATLIWQGTMLVRRTLNVVSGRLELRPDDGEGTPTRQATDSATTVSAFVPKYNIISLGRPVPLLVPRMVWTFE